MGLASIWNEVKPLQATTGCQIYGNATAWWTAEMSIKFLRFHFANREAPDERVLLLWDDFSGHWTEEVVQYAESIGVVLVKVPPRYTFVCQPADISWDKPLKDVLRKRWVQNLQEQITEFHTLVEQQKQDAAQARALEDEARRRASIAHGVTPLDVSPGVGESSPLQTESPRRQATAPASVPTQAATVPEWAMRSTNASDSSEPDSDAERLAARVPRRRRQLKKKSGFELAAPKRRHIIVWIAEAWSAMTRETIVNGFAKAGLLSDTRCCGENDDVSPGDVGEILDKLQDASWESLRLSCGQLK
ncbi:hypothetical protein PR003_g6626 [Phytophthora rubi]|uniref:DDE-1 domain-containing protein n=1 Tax=Phytophthora rubi TaxID=129364 RepID=A0A6A4FPA6_9STRA|nr:hypothetical protein PR001_g3820 [Phytophthora rubi]KAE9348011.1 hypothetical protein PR003_g6626 [Phytophthora rubi]